MFLLVKYILVSNGMFQSHSIIDFSSDFGKLNLPIEKYHYEKLVRTGMHTYYRCGSRERNILLYLPKIKNDENILRLLREKQLEDLLK